MNYKDILIKYRPEFEKILVFLKNEMQKVRTGQASPVLVESVIVDYMGTKLPIKQLGSISCPEPRQIVIQPWDKSSIEPIEKALSQANLGMSPVVDKDCIRLILPPLTEEYRKELQKVIAEKKEMSRQTIRKWRETAWSEIQEKFTAKEIREDDKFRGKDELQKMVDEYNAKIEEAIAAKIKEIMG